jgi:hypothetical protein
MNNSDTFKILFLLVVFGNSLVFAGSKTTFFLDDTSYSFSVTVPSNLNCLDLSKMLFDQKTLRKFSYFVDSVHFSSSDSFSQIVEIYFRKWFYKGYSRYRRVLFPADSLTIDLIKFEHNIPSIPQLKKATIRYYFDSNKDGCAVRYQQRVVVNKKISFVYRKMIELQLSNFTRTLENCVKSGPDINSKL